MLDLILTILFGGFGYWQFKQGKTSYGIIWLFTGGLCGIGWVIDIFSAYKAYKKPQNEENADKPIELLRLNQKTMTVHQFNCRLVNADMPKCRSYEDAKRAGYKACRICMKYR